MPDHTNSDDSLLTPDGAPTAPATAGALLKAARQAAGVHLAVLSVNLKVPVRQLEALEADQYAANESPVFVRALASSVCRQLRVDPAPILALLPLSANYLEPTGVVRHAYVAPADLGRLRRSSGALPAQAKWAAVGMLVMIAALIWMPHPAQWTWLDAMSAALRSSEPAPQAPVSSAATVTEMIVPNAAVPESSTQVAGQGLPPAGPVVVPGTPGMPATAPMTPATAPSSTAMPEPAKAAALPAVSPKAELVFSARNTSWVEVRDSQNQLLWNGVLNAGDAKRLDTVASVSVVVGRADAVQVSFKGQPVDLQPHTKVNVARFEVKP